MCFNPHVEGTCVWWYIHAGTVCHTVGTESVTHAEARSPLTAVTFSRGKKRVYGCTVLVASRAQPRQTRKES